MTGLPLLRPSTVTIHVTAAGWIEGAKGVSEVSASVCGECGFTEFYADKPKTIWEEWKKHHT